MRQTIRHQLLIAGVAAIALFTNLGATRLWDQDEAFFARTAVEMQERHEWVVPYFNGELFAHKPPLMFWMMRLGYMLFGVNEFAARFWSAVFGLATALLVYRLGRRMFNPLVGLWSGLAMATALMFNVVARAATADSFLVFFSALALYLFARNENWEEDSQNQPAANNFAVLTWRTCVAMYAAMGFAVLVKGPIGVLLPGSVIGLYLLMRDIPVGVDHGWTEQVLSFLRRFTPDRIVRAVWCMRPLTVIVTVGVVAGPWFALVGLRTSGNFLREFFGTQNFGRFMGAMDNHSGGIWYYPLVMVMGFFPWSIFSIPTVLDLVARCRGTQSWQRGGKFVACWILVYLCFFSAAATKLPNYVLPAYPALALATGCFIQAWLSQSDRVNRWWPRLSFGSLALVGGVTAVTMPLIAKGSFHGRSILEQLGVSADLTGDIAMTGWLGLMLLIGGLLGIVLIEMGKRGMAMLSLAATSVIFSVTLFAVIAVQVDRHQPSPNVAEIIRTHSDGTAQIAQFGYFRPSLVYYTDSRIDACKTPQRLIDFLEQSTSSFVVTTDEQYGKVSAQLPADIGVIAKCAEFPRRGEVVILGKKALVARHGDERTE